MRASVTSQRVAGAPRARKIAGVRWPGTVDRRVRSLGARLARGWGPALLQRLTTGASEAQIERRFSPSAVQSVLFGTMARAFVPAAADGFQGRVRYELARPATGATALVWTIEVEAGHASAHRGATAPAELIVRFRLADFIAIAAGAIDQLGRAAAERPRVVGGRSRARGPAARDVRGTVPRGALSAPSTGAATPRRVPR